MSSTSQHLKQFFPPTTSRVELSSRSEAIFKIKSKLRKNVQKYVSNVKGIDARLKVLDSEWDVERVLELASSTLLFCIIALSLFVGKQWILAIPLMVSAFLWVHAVQGWCPPLPVLRHFGFRTATEILEEKAALKMIRGDFGKSAANDVDDILVSANLHPG
mmetsp:Transcript_5825/g.22114  ORF Transcript_5825/g.22114 Transcript_5825/m.22114 type:complete len:161 (-) Transcript_5825:3182-3664(-)